MQTTNVNNVNYVNGTQQNQGTGKSELGKDDFLKLMLEQLKYQDPLNPMESNEYSAQLAQFSSLEQLQNMNTSLNESLNANYALAQSVNNTMSTNLIGKEVKIRGNEINNHGQESQSFAYKLGADAKFAKIHIKDEAGKTIKTIELTNTKAGEYKVEWDMKDNTGKSVPHGKYNISLETEGIASKDISSELYQVGLVNAMRFTDKGSMIVIDNREYSLSEVYEIINPSNTGA